MSTPRANAIDVQFQAENAWRTFTKDRNLPAHLGPWTNSTAPDGCQYLSAEVTGRGAAHALRLFAGSDHHQLSLRHPGDQRPAFDVDSPGRTGLVWRSCGVWVELWHPDPVPAVPAPAEAAPAAAMPAAAPGASRILGRASARLPFGRQRKTPAR
ncbi:hypothetical protein DMH12_24965 [Streptomyces sp. WAC 04229]|uniref:hypothetical protein n=1 Tax=Streptomyces sp. WAC 04229 TaxID=2203206 RepID=UPI000F73A73D|nr:hypothetical protein [Streptomyces sp. WAC 04229]RSN50535.1 hypothetical protein DMH12_24965 [Streptomyces sp. WAC 04229]